PPAPRAGTPPPRARPRQPALQSHTDDNHGHRHHEQPSNWGTSSTSSSPLGPNHLRSRSDAVPSWYIVVTARLTASHPSMSPLRRPTPERSPANGALTISRSGAEKPVSTRSPAETASTSHLHGLATVA